ncbi:MAG: hypothetical protein CVT71_01325, partial [Alphaproteobacteria bacterium HGW-Alphaproteobacteria-10]
MGSEAAAGRVIVRVCIAGHSAEGLSGEHSGGSERQSALLAVELAARGHDVTYVVAGDAGVEGTVAAVTVRGAWRSDAGVRFARALTHRYPNLYGVLRSTRADVYYARGAGFYTPFVVRAALDGGARCVLGLASDRDLSSS